MECIFCAIANKSLVSRIIYEDAFSVAFLDITPRSKGMCLVIPKKHIEDFNQDMEIAKECFETALIVEQKIMKALKPLTVFIALLPSQVPHAHIRVYPVYEKEIPLIENKPIQTNDAELDEIAKKLKSVNIEKPKKNLEEPKPKEEKKEIIVEKKEKEDTSWIKRYFEVA
ncbi:MAG: HIT family protein [Candidatus Aenigmarchaeota archaeon]|nr:HIT family protein [Candidatus Aenigmarchaeota archaeon]MBU5688967.1 HIT family protein [Candidatus Aenigmarchaeota archaeon]